MLKPNVCCFPVQFYAINVCIGALIAILGSWAIWQWRKFANSVVGPANATHLTAFSHESAVVKYADNRDGYLGRCGGCFRLCFRPFHKYRFSTVMKKATIPQQLQGMVFASCIMGEICGAIMMADLVYTRHSYPAWIYQVAWDGCTLSIYLIVWNLLINWCRLAFPILLRNASGNSTASATTTPLSSTTQLFSFRAISTQLYAAVRFLIKWEHHYHGFYVLVTSVLLSCIMEHVTALQVAFYWTSVKMVSLLTLSVSGATLHYSCGLQILRDMQRAPISGNTMTNTSAAPDNNGPVSVANDTTTAPNAIPIPIARAWEETDQTVLLAPPPPQVLNNSTTSATTTTLTFQEKVQRIRVQNQLKRQTAGGGNGVSTTTVPATATNTNKRHTATSQRPTIDADTKSSNLFSQLVVQDGKMMIVPSGPLLSPSHTKHATTSAANIQDVAVSDVMVMEEIEDEKRTHHAVSIHRRIRSDDPTLTVPVIPQNLSHIIDSPTELSTTATQQQQQQQQQESSPSNQHSTTSSARLPPSTGTNALVLCTPNMTVRLEAMNEQHTMPSIATECEHTKDLTNSNRNTNNTNVGAIDTANPTVSPLTSTTTTTTTTIITTSKTSGERTRERSQIVFRRLFLTTCGLWAAAILVQVNALMSTLKTHIPSLADNTIWWATSVERCKQRPFDWNNFGSSTAVLLVQQIALFSFLFYFRSVGGNNTATSTNKKQRKSKFTTSKHRSTIA